jgi:hypothetical protein
MRGTCIMKDDRETCLERAADCLRMAEQFSGNHREQLKHIAAEWLRLADDQTAEATIGAVREASPDMK